MKAFHRHLFMAYISVFSINIQAKTFLVFGGNTGWIGQKLVTILRTQGHTVHCATSRLEQREHIENEINTIQPDAIINAAGITGRPNVNWCETHQQETIRANLLGVLNLVDLAYQHNIHVTNLATGCIYQYDTQHPLGSGIGFTEEEKPNFTGSFYSRMKVLMEEAITPYPNLLNLRVRMPIAADLSPRGFVGKVAQYKKLVNIPNSMTILEDLLPLISQMVERNLTGTYNFVNPGTISHNEVMDLYIQYIDPDHTYENFSIEEQDELLKVPRSNCELSAAKLCNEFPSIPHIKDALTRTFQKIKSQKQIK